jgi:hypothetical protein
MEIANRASVTTGTDTSEGSLQKPFLLSLLPVGSIPSARNAPAGTNSVETGVPWISVAPALLNIGMSNQ